MPGFEVIIPRAVRPLVDQRAGYREVYAQLERDPCAEVLFVARREPRHRESDAWTILHDLFGVENPPEGHHKQPCCQAGVPDLPDDELDGFLREVHRLTRGR